jgi:hypothetical protein
LIASPARPAAPPFRSASDCPTDCPTGVIKGDETVIIREYGDDGANGGKSLRRQ